MIILKILGVAIILYVITWILFTIWSKSQTKSHKERISMQRWFFIVSLLGIFGVTTQWIMFFPAWYHWKRGSNRFCWWMDDSRFDESRPSGWAHDYEVHLNGREETMWIAYWWHMRNMIWNFQNSYRVKPQTITTGNQNITITRLITDNLHKCKNGTKLPLDGIYGIFAGLKYWKNGESTWQTMNGSHISIDKSIIGNSFTFTLMQNNQLIITN